MSDIPVGWEQTRLGNLGRYINGRGFKSSEWSTSGRPIIRIQNLTGSSSTVNYYDGKVEQQYVVEPGDLLISWSATLGAYFWSGPQAVLNQHIFRVESFINKRFHKYLVDHVLRELMNKAHGSGMVHITRKPFDETPVLLPPLAEQARVVAAIEEQFSRLDAGVAALKRARQNLRRIRAAVLEAAVTSAGEQTTPKVALGDLVVSDRKIAYGVLVPGDHVPAGVPLVRVGDLSNRQVNTQDLKHIAPAIAARYPRTRLQGGEVLLSLVGTIGRTAVVPPELAGANAARAIAVIPVKETVEPRYVAIALSRDRVTWELTNLSHEVARKTLNLEDVRRYEIPLPSYPEQLEIVKAVETEETWIKAAEEAVARTLRRAEHLRSSILQTAFAGSLVPQDPADEPASALLQRIAVEEAGPNGHTPKRGRKPRALPEEVTP